MTTAQDQQSRAEFEKAMRAEPNHWVNRDFYRDPLGADLYEDRGTQAAWSAWQAARALPAPENVRAGEPYDNPAFEDLARTMGVWGTAQAALCAQFFLAGRGALPAGMEPELHMTRKTIGEVDGFPVWEYEECCEDDDDAIAFFTAAQVLAMGRVPPGWQAVPLRKPLRNSAIDRITFSRSAQNATDHGRAIARAVEAKHGIKAAAPRPPAAQEDSNAR